MMRRKGKEGKGKKTFFVRTNGNTAVIFFNYNTPLLDIACAYVQVIAHPCVCYMLK